MLLADAYIASACHLWNTPPPRPFLYLLDLERFARSTPDPDALAREVSTVASTFDLQLFVALAAACAAELWGRPHRLIADELEGELSCTERAFAGSGVTFDLPLGQLVLARLLSGRRSRSGWRAPARRLWPHPAQVEEATSAQWSWPRRRVAYQLRLLRRRARRPG